MPTKDRNFSVVIIAAGNSERMGMPKLGLKFDASTSFAEKIIGTILEIEPLECVLVINHDGLEFINRERIKIPDKVKIVINEDPEKGRFYSIQYGLKELVQREKVFIVNIDNPFLDIDILKKMLDHLKDKDFNYPVYLDQGGHPLLINKRVVEGIMSHSNYSIILKEFLKSYRKKTITVTDKKVLVNINTPEDYNSLFGLTSI